MGGVHRGGEQGQGTQMWGAQGQGTQGWGTQGRGGRGGVVRPGLHQANSNLARLHWAPFKNPMKKYHFAHLEQTSTVPRDIDR